MVNLRYRKGRAKEYRLKRQLEKAGYIVLRMSGSHGFCDIVSIDPEKKTVYFIQVKPKNFPESQKEKLEKKYEWLNDIFACEFDVR